MVKENQKILNAMMAMLDVAICIFSMILAFKVHFLFYKGSYIGINYYMQLMLIIVPVYFLLYNYFELQKSFCNKSLTWQTSKIIQSNFIGAIFIFVLTFFLKQVHISRMVIILFAVFNSAMTLAYRILIRYMLRQSRKKGYNLKYLLLIGWNDVSAEFYDRITANKDLGYKFIGYISGKKEDTSGREIDYAGNFSEIPIILEHAQIDGAVLSLNYSEFPMLGNVIDECEKAGVKSDVLPFYMKYLPSRPYIDEVEGMPLINIHKIPLDNLLNSFVKRGFDIAASLILLIVLSPLLLFTAIGVKLSSPGPVIYKQQRMGKNRKPFVIYKFRSMTIEHDGSDLTTWGGKTDARRTKFGAFIRKFSIDELPQLVNVLKGDMSLVGPRPERQFFVEKFKEEVPLYMIKHLVRPGITGWAQINGWRGDTSIVERIKCDIYYIENWSFVLDIKILFMTIWKGIVNHSEKM